MGFTVFPKKEILPDPAPLPPLSGHPVPLLPAAVLRGKQSCMLETRCWIWSRGTGAESSVCLIFIVFSWAEYLNCLKCSSLTVPWELECKAPWTVWKNTWENICWSAERNSWHLGSSINIGWMNEWEEGYGVRGCYGLNSVPSKFVCLSPNS